MFSKATKECKHEQMTIDIRRNNYVNMK